MCTGQYRPQAAKLSIKPGGVRYARVANVHMCACMRGNDVRNCTARNYGGLHSDSAPWVIHLHQARDLQYKFVNSVDSGCGVETGVSRASRDNDFGCTDAFASGLQLPFETEGRFKHQDSIAPPRFALHFSSRSIAANFFIGVPKENEALAEKSGRRSVRALGETRTDFFERVHRKQRQRNARFHVEYSR